MSVNFPTALDAFVSPTALDHLNTPAVLHHVKHADHDNAITAIESKVGIDFSSITNTLDFIAKLFMLTQLEHPDGAFRECLYVGGFPPIMSSVTWYTSSAKTIKLVEKTYTYGVIKIIPTKITLKLYDGTLANVLKRTITDTITYKRVFETSRTRIIT